jgi:hypothetical protein
MIVSDIASSENDEFYTPTWAIEPLIKYLPKGARVWCPFDIGESLIVAVLDHAGHPVTYTHLATGGDFFTSNETCDLIISNPPYSVKTEVFARLFELGKPFAMLVGIAGLFEGPRFRLFRDNPPEIMYLNSRVAYLRSYQEASPSISPPFSSAWVCRGILPQQMVFETMPVRDNMNADKPA